MKLHIGCGSNILPGYINIDEYNPNADVNLNVMEMNYDDESIDVVEGYMILEHLTLSDARKLLKKLYKMLKKGGRLILEVPDMEKVCKMILAFADDPECLEQGPFGFRGIFGDPAGIKSIGDVHKWGYTRTSLSALVREAGFAKCIISDGISHHYPLRDMRVEATK